LWKVPDGLAVIAFISSSFQGTALETGAPLPLCHSRELAAKAGRKWSRAFDWQIFIGSAVPAATSLAFIKTASLAQGLHFGAALCLGG